VEVEEHAPCTCTTTTSQAQVQEQEQAQAQAATEPPPTPAKEVPMLTVAPTSTLRALRASSTLMATITVLMLTAEDVYRGSSSRCSAALVAAAEAVAGTVHGIERLPALRTGMCICPSALLLVLLVPLPITTTTMELKATPLPLRRTSSVMS
jgi:hypothetical protein